MSEGFDPLFTSWCNDLGAVADALDGERGVSRLQGGR
jgi:hypothetical protein